MVWCPLILAQCVIVRRVVGRPSTPPLAPGSSSTSPRRARRTAPGASTPSRRAASSSRRSSYVALRLLDVPADDPLTSAARGWLRAQPGGVLAIPTWGKFWLALLGLYDYARHQPVPARALLLPRWLPIHPRRYYCHTRHIYLGMSYSLRPAGPRAARPDRGGTLRRSSTEGPARASTSRAAPRRVAERPRRPSGVARPRLADLLVIYERIAPASLRRRALARGLEQIRYEQRQSRYQGLSPVNGLLNCLALWTHDPAHPDLEPSLAGVEAWRWEDREAGVRYAGARSHAWDTAFARKPSSTLPPTSEVETALRRAYRFLASTQLTEELPDREAADRDAIVGGWCFSDGAHRWPVSDCTAEALVAILRIHSALGDRAGRADPRRAAPRRR